MLYPYLKALHIIFVVTWFAGLFYMPRLLIYCREALEIEDPKVKDAFIKQYQLMQRRLWYGITWPSMIITWALGLSLTFKAWLDPMPTWLVWKICFVVVLTLYHLITHSMFRQQGRLTFKYSSMQLRIWNEIATIFLFMIVFLVVLKQLASLYFAIGILIALIVLLMSGIMLYRRFRKS